MRTAHRNHATHEDPMGTKICELPEWRRPSRFPWFFSSLNLSGLRAFVVQPDSGGSGWIRPLKCFLKNEVKLCRPCRDQKHVGGCFTQGVAALCHGLSYYRPFRTCRGSVVENCETNPINSLARFTPGGLKSALQ